MNCPKNILIVEDSTEMRRIMKGILREGGYEISGEAGDGIEAVEKYKELHPSLVLLDLIMPREHGLNALNEIMNYDSDAKVIIVTGVRNKRILMSAIEAGATSFIFKPFNELELLRVVDRGMKEPPRINSENEYMINIGPLK